MRSSHRFTILSCIVFLIVGSVNGALPRRGLQQGWPYITSAASGTSQGSSASAFASAEASSGAAASSQSFAQSGGNSESNTNWGANLAYDQGQQVNQASSNIFGSLMTTVQGYFRAGNNQQAPQAQQGVQLPPQEQQSQQEQQQPQQAVQVPNQNTNSPMSLPSNGLSTAYAQQSLETHNFYRAKHQSTPTLRWSSSLEADAQKWANRCVFEHSDNVVSGQGENLAWGYPDAKSVIDAYYNEGAGYSYGVSQPADWHSIGHFTQVVWRSTNDLGCAVATCSGGQLFHVCRYYPPGNVQGQYADNVMPLAA